MGYIGFRGLFEEQLLEVNQLGFKARLRTSSCSTFDQNGFVVVDVVVVVVVVVVVIAVVVVVVVF